jgi:hypothetical protein
MALLVGLPQDKGWQPVTTHGILYIEIILYNYHIVGEMEHIVYSISNPWEIFSVQK